MADIEEPPADFPLNIRRIIPHDGLRHVVADMINKDAVDVRKVRLSWVRYDATGKEIGRTDLIPPLLRDDINTFADNASAVSSPGDVG